MIPMPVDLNHHPPLVRKEVARRLLDAARERPDATIASKRL
jgi:hypothetical protein